MKKALVVFVILLEVLVLSSCFFSSYSENTELINLYNNNKSLFQTVVDENGDSVGSISNDRLKNKGVEKIFAYSDYICFEVPNDYCYQGIIYSKSNSFIEKVPFERGSELLEKKDFEEIDENTKVKGKVNNGEDWFLVSKINDNWFYYEFHKA